MVPEAAGWFAIPPPNRYKEAFVDYIKEVVLPSLKKHHDEHLLRQLKLRWDNHKVCGMGGALVHDMACAAVVAAALRCARSCMGGCTVSGAMRGRSSRADAGASTRAIMQPCSAANWQPWHVAAPADHGALAVALLQLPRPLLHPGACFFFHPLLRFFPPASEGGMYSPQLPFA